MGFLGMLLLKRWQMVVKKALYISKNSTLAAWMLNPEMNCDCCCPEFVPHQPLQKLKVPIGEPFFIAFIDL
jgi:hypothetical protein